MAEEDAEDFHVARFKPESLDKLCKVTLFSRREIKIIYRGFKQECPTGHVDEETFVKIFSQLFPLGDASRYAHYVFSSLEKSQAGSLNFEEFLLALSTLSRGPLDEKISWIFSLYDLNKDGVITKTEMMAVVSSVYEMLGAYTKPLVTDSSAAEHVSRIFKLIKHEDDGVISMNEFLKWCRGDEGIKQALCCLDTFL